MKLTSNILVVICLTVFFNLDISAQEIIPANDTTVYYSAEEYPVLIKADREYKLNEIQEFIKYKMNYPVDETECTGKVLISFYIEKDGTVSNKKFIQKLCPKIDKNSMSIVDLMEKWKPAMSGEKPIRLKVTIPFYWKIE